MIQPTGKLQQNGHMAVVAAGVHDAGMGGGVGCSGFFGNGQGVHIRAEGNCLGLAEVKPGAQSAAPGRKNLAGQAGQGLFQIRLGFGKLQLQLGNPVQCMTVSVYLHKNASWAK